VVDKNNFPFRGEYELARIDVFEAYGRGYGEDINLGEQVKTWILKPGVYKIFGVGQSYNTMTNFVTIRLLPGELTHVMLVQDNQQSMTIIGGGQISTQVNRTLFASNWRYGINMGGSIDFNANTDHQRDSTDMYTTLALLLNARLKYEKEKVEWESWLTVDESIDFSYNFVRKKLAQLRSASDDLRLQSLYTWHFLPWFGPYGRLEAETELLPKYERGSGDTLQYFGIANNDTVLQSIDSLRDAILTSPSFSPFSFEAGIGANTKLIRNAWVEGRLLTGFGYKQSWLWNRAEVVDSLNLPDDSAHYTDVEKKFDSIPQNKVIIRKLSNTITSPEYGPEASLYGILRLGRYATAETELKVFAPIKRMIEKNRFNPDVRWRATLSWRLLKSVTIDYQYEFDRAQPLGETSLHKKTSRHRVLLRFSITSR
jgi:hypothetical protein